MSHNDWSSVRAPDLGAWQPSLSVSVVIPAYDCQGHLDLTLASLAQQTYPQDLLEVVVVDDGSDPPLTLPQIRPQDCRIVRPAENTWGIANAVETGVRASSGEVIHRLDADMIVHPQHVESLARWHTEVPYAVALGHKEFVDVRPGSAGWPTPADVVKSADPGSLFNGVKREAHEYHERLLRTTDQLRAADHLVFMAHVGATVSLRRELYERAGGYRSSMLLGEDTEFGFRLAQAGAVFISDVQARSWHLGRTHMMDESKRLQRYNRPHLADAMPLPRWLRKVGGSAWAVPLVTVVVDVGGHPLERVRAVIDAVLSSSEQDLRVYAVGPWSALANRRRHVLDDPDIDLRLLAETYKSDLRVRLVERAPDPFPSPYLLQVPPTAVLAPSAIGRMIGEADRHQSGLAAVGGLDSGLQLWRTAALARARWVAYPGESLTKTVEETFGVRILEASEVGVLDVSDVPIDALVNGLDVNSGPVARGRWLPSTVEVGGIRTLALATAVVAKATARRVRIRIVPRRRRTSGAKGVMRDVH